jgi:hypothetical protein
VPELFGAVHFPRFLLHPVPNKTKATITVAPETHYEIRRLAKLWESIAQAWEVCCHYTARQAGADDAAAALVAEIRQAQAKVEILKRAT